MLKKIEDLNYYELLEISPSATSQDVHKAYDRVRRIYEPNSIALYSLFSAEEIARIRQRIEDAYRTLIHEENRRRYDRMLRDRHELPELEPPGPKYRTWPAQLRPGVTQQPDDQRLPVPTEPLATSQEPADLPAQEHPKTAPSQVTEFTGTVIRALREQAGLSIRNIADLTKISSRYLEYIEAEEFKKLPARPYLRGFLVLYAKALGCDPERMISDYLKRYSAALEKAR